MMRAELGVVKEQLKKAARLAKLLEMHVQVDAVVLKVAERPAGSAVREAEPLFTLIPLDAALEAKVEIRVQDIGYLRPNDRTRIKLGAFPFQKHGIMEGSLRFVSEDAFKKDNGDQSQSGMYYEGRAHLGEKN
jgi:hemolysin D